MKNFIKKKIWKRWRPNLRDENSKENNIVKSLTIKKDYSSKKDSKKKMNKKNLQQYLKGYQIGLDTGYQRGWFQGFNSISLKYLKNYEQYLQIQFSNILKCFWKSINDLDSQLELKLLKMIVKISKIVVSNSLLINENFILDKIKNILKNFRRTLRNPKLFIHPQKKKIIEEKFGRLLKLYNWTLSTDKKINMHSCYVLADEGEIDATVERCWNEIEQVLLVQKDKI
ncbi:FliH/SctL family protein [Buchnera aphidicola]|uniref:FliH/SctL family protein n=1 Tax=Buchnera aphidicola TaxID=9 RepID=UPI00094C4F5F|nr:FliH/SctL family protein [Buchnera aphidicola]